MNKKILLLASLVLLGKGIKAQEIQYTQRLEESVISAETFETTLIDTPKNVTVITSEDIEEKGAKTVAEALKGVPNLTVKNMGGTDSAFDLRGQGTTAFSNVIVLLDGVPLNSIDMSGYKTNQIPIDTIDRIEVIPSGGSVMYGDGAVGGTINIITKAPQNKANYGSVNVEAGSYDTFRSNVNYGTKLADKTFLNLNYSTRNSDGYRADSKDDMESLRIKVKQLLENGDMDFGYAYSEYDFKSNGAIYGKENAENDPQQKGGWTVEGTNRYDEYTFNFRKRFTDKLDFILNSRLTEQEYREEGWKFDTETIYIKPQFKYSYYGNSYLILGGDYLRGKTDILKSWSGKGSLKKESEGIFAVNKFVIGNLELQQGYRRQHIEYTLKDGDKNKFDENALDLSANYLFSEVTSAYISYNTAFRTPNTDELNYWDGDFDVQTSRTIETGVKTLIGNTFISGAVFHIETDNEIVYAHLNGSDGSFNRNLDGKNRRSGVELSMEHYFGKLTLREEIGYIDHQMTSGTYDGKEIPGVSNVNGRIGLSYEATPALTLNGDAYYYGKAYASDNFKNSGEKVDDYITVDINARYKVDEGLTVYAGINNLFDEQYYNYVLGSDLNTASYYPANGRNYYAGFKYDF